ncbi:MAG: protein kinase [Candidatus Hydrogenedentes bacterium]|nr:protein kinase [Candidatus Hydrogenedentota bacterium]
MERDRNLIFGLMAVQLRQITPTQFVEAAAVWAEAGLGALDEILVEKGYLEATERDFLQMVVGQVIKAHGGNATASLAAVGGEEELQTIVSLGREASLGRSLSSHLGWNPEEMAGQLRKTVALREAPDRYVTVRMHDEGGMGRVYLVHDAYLDREIALKELRIEGEDFDSHAPAGSTLAHSQSDTARFLHEAQITARLEHPSIVPIYEVGRRDDGAYYYTMRFVHGRTLRDVIRGEERLEGRLRLLTHFVTLCQAIAYAHHRGILHRDIKPANIMIGEYGETMVIDWGLATAVANGAARARDGKSASCQDAVPAAATPFSSSNAPLGTPYYMPPEQAAGRLEEVDIRSDVYSLGAVLYEILAGKHPFGGHTKQEVLDQVLQGDLHPLEQAVPEVPPELAQICRKAMARRPEDRYAKADELAEDIIRYQTGALVQVYKYSFFELLWKHYRRRRTVVNIAAAGILAVLLIAVYSYAQIYRAREREVQQRKAAEQARDSALLAERRASEAQHGEALARERAEQEAYVARMQLAQQFEAGGDYEGLRTVLEETVPGFRGWEWDYLHAISDEASHTLRGHSSVVNWLQFSPEGARALSFGADQSIRVWDLIAGTPLSMIDPQANRASLACWTPDGQSIAVSTWNGQILFFDPATAQQLRVLNAESVRINYMCFSIDKERLYTASDDGVLGEWDWQRGVLLRSQDLGQGAIARIFPDHAGRLLFTESAVPNVTAWRTDDFTIAGSAPGRFGAVSGDDALLCTVTGTDISIAPLSQEGPPRSWRAHDELVSSTGFLPGSHTLVSNGIAGTVRAWNADTGEQRFQLPLPDSACRAVVNATTGELAVLSARGRISLWDSKDGTLLGHLHGHTGNVVSGVFSPDGSRLVTSGMDLSIRVWEEAERTRDVLSTLQSSVRKLAMRPDGKELTAGLYDSTINTIDPQSLTRHHVLGAFTLGGVGALAYRADGRQLAACLGDSGVAVFDAENHRLEQYLYTMGSIASCAYIGDTTRLVLNPHYGPIQVIDTGTGETTATFEQHDTAPSIMAVSETGDWIAVGSDSGELTVWPTSGGAPRFVLPLASSRIVALAFLDENRLVTGDFDGNIRVVDCARGEKIFESLEPGREVHAICPIPGSGRFAVAARSQSVRIWDVDYRHSLIEIPVGGHGVDAMGMGGGALWAADSGSGLHILRTERHGGRGIPEGAVPPSAQPGPVPFDVYISPEHHERTVRFFLAQAEGMDFARAPEALPAALAQRAARWCLHEGDQILEFDGQAVSTWPEFVTRVQGALAEGALPKSVLLRRASESLALSFHSVPMKSESREVVLARAEAAAFFEAVPSFGPVDRQFIQERSANAAQAIGENLQDGRLPGIEIGLPQNAAQAALIARMSLVPGSMMIRIDGVAMESMEILEQTSSAMLRRIQSQTVDSFEIELEMGLFQRLRLDYRLTE